MVTWPFLNSDVCRDAARCAVRQRQLILVHSCVKRNNFTTLCCLFASYNLTCRSHYTMDLWLKHALCICCRPSVCRLSVCNARAPYSGGWNFRQYFYCIWYLGHPLTFRKKIYGDRTRGTPPSGELNTRGVAKYSDFGLIDGYISETVQDTR